MQIAGNTHQVRLGADVLLALGDEAAPRRARRLDADADVGQGRLGQDRARDAQGDRDDHRAHAVGQQVPGDDPPIRDADRLGGLDELRFLERQQLAADQPGDGHP